MINPVNKKIIPMVMALLFISDSAICNTALKINAYSLRPPMKFNSAHKRPARYQTRIRQNPFAREIYSRITELKNKLERLKREETNLITKLESGDKGAPLSEKKLEGINKKIQVFRAKSRQQIEELSKLKKEMGVLLEFMLIIKKSAYGRINPLTALRKKSGFSQVKLTSVQSRALKYVGTLSKKDGFNFSKKEIFFIPADSPICRFFDDSRGLCFSTYYGKDIVHIIFISDAQNTFMRIVATLVHEIFHKRFSRGRNALFKKNPELFWLGHFLNEAMTEYLTRQKLKGKGHKLSYLHQTYDQEVLFLKRFFNEYGDNRGKKVIFDFLEKAETDGLEEALGSSVWQKLLHISAILAENPGNTLLKEFCNKLIEVWMRDERKELVLNDGIRLLEEFVKIRRILGIPDNRLNEIKIYAMDFLLYQKENISLRGFIVKHFAEKLKREGIPRMPEDLDGSEILRIFL